jgi:hypothetical protein
MPQTQVIVMADREGDVYELHHTAAEGLANLHVLVRAQHDRNLVSHQKLWAHMAGLPIGARRTLHVPQQPGQAARTATVEVRWAQVTIQPPAVGCKKRWPPVSVWALWVHEPEPPCGVAALDWMLLSDQPITTADEAWERVQWYCRRWTIEEWHRVLKSGCGVEQREFETAQTLQRALAFDLIVAWRVLACVKLGRQLPQLPATVLYTAQELAVLEATFKKKTATAVLGRGPQLWRRPTAWWPDGAGIRAASRMVRPGPRASASGCVVSTMLPSVGSLDLRTGAQVDETSV